MHNRQQINEELPDTKDFSVYSTVPYIAIDPASTEGAVTMAIGIQKADIAKNNAIPNSVRLFVATAVVIVPVVRP